MSRSKFLSADHLSWNDEMMNDEPTQRPFTPLFPLGEYGTAYEKLTEDHVSPARRRRELGAPPPNISPDRQREE